MRISGCSRRSVRCLDVGEEGVHDLLHGLSIEGEPAFGGLLQLALPRPLRVSHAGCFMGLRAEIPHAGRFHLCCFETPQERWRQVIQAIHANGFHVRLFFFFARKTVKDSMGSKASGVAFTPSIGRGRALPLRFVADFTHLAIIDHIDALLLARYDTLEDRQRITRAVRLSHEFELLFYETVMAVPHSES